MDINESLGVRAKKVRDVERCRDVVYGGGVKMHRTGKDVDDDYTIA